MKTRTVLAIAALTVSGGLASLAIAGPITPPSGPVGSTYKTLTETEPRVAINATNTPGDSDSVFRITQSGSYYLTASLTNGVAGKAGIEIAASDVTIDLGGFTLDGGTLIGQIASLDGIRSQAAVRNIIIKNGVVKDWAGDGLDLVSVTNLVVTDVIMDSNAAAGMLPGNFSRIERCHFTANSSHGVNVTAPGVIVRECTAAQNGASGIRVAGVGARIERCTTESNSVHGIDVSNQAVIEDNICAFNGLGASVTDGSGIKVSGTGARVVSNHLTSNDKGIWVTNDTNIVYQNWASQNSAGNYDWTTLHGFALPFNITYADNFIDETSTYRNFMFAP